MAKLFFHSIKREESRIRANASGLCTMKAKTEIGLPTWDSRIERQVSSAIMSDKVASKL